MNLRAGLVAVQCVVFLGLWVGALLVAIPRILTS